jgi:hypothetical protein
MALHDKRGRISGLGKHHQDRTGGRGNSRKVIPVLNTMISVQAIICDLGEWKMDWNRKYIIKSYIRNSLWFIPFLSLLAFLVIGRITYGIGGWLLWTGQIDETTAFYGLTMVGARSGS